MSYYVSPLASIRQPPRMSSGITLAIIHFDPFAQRNTTYLSIAKLLIIYTTN